MSASALAPRARKNHYIPEFYLKQWAGPDGRLCEFSRPYRRIVPRMTFPGGTGYKQDLYTIPTSQLEIQQYLEDQFFKVSDQLAADALQLLLSDKLLELAKDDKSGWSRFILSLVQRNPEKLDWIKKTARSAFERRMAEVEQSYESFRLPSDPPTFEAYKSKWWRSPLRSQAR